ncbi:MbtH family protein [Plantactinospora sp. KLBMP9567]|uniref:MbtH family protein n=1 Tax=Plantactinospora sp. KLBMP9567 TaxID=3085900 RepID=UPI002981E0B8|nr:MbtH family NRPS accessory protein [Plantactinospora sp. KLBMP9567]MDW5322284.1 MbtH family NRPS accessory protein [Plantactinospora sp. KLBMP9567]
MTPPENDEQFTVVRNEEEQYSVWWSDRTLPAGWLDAGFTGTRQECLDHIDRVWTDLRPASLRRFMTANRAA